MVPNRNFQTMAESKYFETLEKNKDMQDELFETQIMITVGFNLEAV